MLQMPPQDVLCRARQQSVRCFSSFNFSQPSKRRSLARGENRSDRSFQDRREGSYRSQQMLSDVRQQQHRQRQQQQQQQQQQHEHEHELFGHRRQRSHDELAGNFVSGHQYLVTCHPGLEKVTAEELELCCHQAGIPVEVHVTAPGRVAFASSDPAAGYAAVLHLRSATRVLELLSEQHLDPEVPAGVTVYEATRAAADWAELLGPKQTLGVHCVHFYNNSNITNSQLVQRRVRDAVCDAVRDARGVRPAPPEGTPDLPLAFQMLNDSLELYRDLGGGSLHRRGYRSDTSIHKAALNEAAAAGLLLLAGWQHTCQHGRPECVDPMCGSGTLLIEAALIATSTAPGLLRNTRASSWSFMQWPGFERRRWEQLLESAQQQSQAGLKSWKAQGGRLLGNDIHGGALKLAARAAAAAGVPDAVSFHSGQCGDWRLSSASASEQHRIVVCNPPWGRRLLTGDPSRHQLLQSTDHRSDHHQWAADDGADFEGDHDLVEAWQQLSHFLKSQCAGGQAWVLSGNPEMSRHLGLRSSSKKAVRLGGEKTMWLQYNIGTSKGNRLSHSADAVAAA